MNPEYSLFTKENPCDALRAMCKGMSIPRKLKIAPYIRRADAQVRKAQSFRDILNDEDSLMSDVIASAFVLYFDKKVDRNGFVAIAQDPTYEFITFIDKLVDDGMKMDDKYIKNVHNMIVRQSDSIDAFIKAFISVRQASRELKKLLK